MAASYVWPLTLPQCAQVGGFSESVGYNIIRTPMDQGPAKIRRRSARAQPLSVSYKLNATQLATLEDFVQNTIKAVARFYFPHPRTGTEVEVRIVPSSEGELYKIGHINGSIWSVTMNLEVLP